MYVSTHSAYGKVLPDCAVVNGHKAPVQEVAFSPFHPGLMATGSNDATVRSAVFHSEIIFYCKYLVLSKMLGENLGCGHLLPH